MELFAVSVFPAPRVSVPVPVVMVFPFTDDGVIAPREMVNAGVAPPEEVPDTPLAVATETAVTVPVVGVCHVAVVPEVAVNT
jgi:hypothetical protein